jgi:hypothetical protein
VRSASVQRQILGASTGALRVVCRPLGQSVPQDLLEAAVGACRQRAAPMLRSADRQRGLRVVSSLLIRRTEKLSAEGEVL